MHLPHHRISNLAAFLVPALSLWLPSGYAYGTALLMVGAMLAVRDWWGRPVLPPEARWLVLAIALMALVWLYGGDWSKGASALNKPLRYLLMLPCLFYVLRFPPRRDWLLAGIAVGACMGGLRALYDTQMLGLERPWITEHDSSNAIQLGNLSGLLGLICWIPLMVYWPRWRWPMRLLLALCCLLGLLGSLLSQTRGGWLALALSGLALGWLLARRVSSGRALIGALLLALILAPLGWHQRQKIEERVQWAYDEVTEYQAAGQASTSVGQRLDHWQLAWHMGLAKPLLGWGEAGYATEKARRVALGQAHPAILAYGHTHNELLDQFVKRGLVGVGGLLVLYLVPLALFWPRRRVRPNTADPGELHENDTCLRLIGVSVPLSFMGFGLTQVFFAHYNGVVIYLDLVILVLGALQATQPRTLPPEGQ